MPSSPSPYSTIRSFLILACLALLAAACAPAPVPQVRLAPGNEEATQAVLELLLTSHDQWFSLVAEGEIKQPSLSGETSTLQTAAFRLGNPNQVRVELFNKEDVLERTWIADGALIYDYDPVSLDTRQHSQPNVTIGVMAIPSSLEAVNGVRSHPLAALIPTKLATFLFPAELAQIAGEYEVAGEEIIDGRATWQLDYANLLTGEEYRSARYWVDQQTGIVLLAQYFGSDGGLLIEYWIHILELDGPVYDDYFRPWF